MHPEPGQGGCSTVHPEPGQGGRSSVHPEPGQGGVFTLTFVTCASVGLANDTERARVYTHCSRP